MKQTQTRFSCDECPKSYARLSTLKDHKRNHTGERPYHCDYCEDRFMSRDTLRSHLAKHSTTKLSCPNCDLSFLRLSSLKRHQRFACTNVPAQAERVSPITNNDIEEPIQGLATDNFPPRLLSHVAPPQLDSLANWFVDVIPMAEEPRRDQIIDSIRSNNWPELFQRGLYSHEWLQNAWTIAADEGCSIALRDLVTAGVDVNSTGLGDQTALHVTSENGFLEAVHTLLNLNAKVDPIDRYHNTPLMLAIESHRIGVIKELLHWNANLFPNSNREYSPLYYAVTSSTPEILQYILMKRPFQELPCHIEPLTHLATQSKDDRNLRFLLNQGANILELSEDNRSLLHSACENKNVPCMKLILQRSDQTRRKTKTELLTPLHILLRPRRVRGGNYSSSKETKEARVKLLLEYGAEIDAVDISGNTPLMCVFETVDDTGFHWNDEILYAKILLASNANPNIMNKNGKTVLDIFWDIAYPLLKDDSEMDPYEKDQWMDNFTTTMTLLLDHGAWKGDTLRKSTTGAVTPL